MRRSSNNTLILPLHFEGYDYLQDWLLSGLQKLPERFHVTYFGEREWPTKKPEFEISNRERFLKYLEKHEYTGGLFGDRFWMHVSKSRGCSWSVTTYFSPRAKVAASDIVELLSVFDKYGAVFGFACSWGEYRRRNGWEISLPEARGGTGGLAQGWFGRSFEKYVPGLFWISYYSNAFATKHGLDPARLAVVLAGTHVKLDSGAILQIYDEPSTWESKNDRVEAVLREDARFFYRGRVDLPTEVFYRETNVVLGRIHEEWP